ncbi:MAG: alpha/beta hydrolase [Pseudomonadota bacterium]|uniref:alpha/beta fold hydrolase n=1 Tax=Polaromonas sp. TaxID=1869339 RepID=UPI001828644E|nr:alpha/beta hydrolase [Polaromonas sp.]MBA3592831.1 alpha/beta hydrolase [Polaromonas sp.]MDQ3270942.1 alpha/beta hydrolase [Pseudomonadota bacterium]
MSWVLLRGLTRETRHWGGLPQQLAATGDAVITLDLPGNGAFCGQRSPPSVRAMALFAREQLRLQGVAPPYRLLAMSLGGMVAADWAQQFPGEVSALVLVNTSVRPFSPATDRLRPRNWLPLLRLAACWDDAAAAESIIHRLTCRHTDTLSQDLAVWQQIRRSAPVSAGNAWCQLWAAARFSAAPTAPACPVLLLSSAGDSLVHPRCSAALAREWRAAHRIHPWAGHDLPHDDAGWVCQQIEQWLAGN